MIFTISQARVRAVLKMTPGARVCGINGCLVITQGGAAGLKLHQQKIHGEELWQLNEEDETWQT